MGTRALDGAPAKGGGAYAPPLRPIAPVVVLALFCCGLYGILHSVPDRSLVLEIVRQSAYLAPFFLAAIASLVAYRRASDRERRLWRGLVVGLLLISLSEAYVSVLVLERRVLTPDASTLPMVVSMIAAVVLIATLFRLTDFRTLSRSVGVRHIIDAAGTSLLLFGAVLALFAVPITARYPASGAIDDLAAALYAVLGILMLIATAVNFATRGWSHWRECERRVIVGVGIYGLATALWPLWYLGSVLNRPLAWDAIIEIMWMAGAFMVFSGAVTRLRVEGADPRFLTLPRMRPRRHGSLSMTMPTLFTFGIPLFGSMALLGSADSLTRTAYAITALGLTFVVAGRSAVSAIENEFLFDKAVNDPLTELYGHRYFHERLKLELEMAARRGARVSVVVLDLDGFSRINGAHGHAFGDAVLQSAASAIRGACRASDVVCRLGADEFAIILPEANDPDMTGVAERIQHALLGVDTGESGQLTASIGLASYPQDSVEQDDLLRKADGALYWAKYHGKNRVVAFDESVVESLSADERIRVLEEQSHLGTVRALAAAVDARDPLTQFHSRNVAVLSVMLAEEVELDEGKRQLIEIAALLHDVGKIGIADRVLRKRGPLNASESRHIREHPGLGEKILRSTQLEEILPWVRHHHERWDGMGYPDGLAGEAIPIEARLLCICDAYDAMTSGRPYRAALSSTAALQELDLCIGTQFDPALTEAFIRLVGKRRLLRPGMHSAREERRMNP
ncbi:MAG: diguanylate cyclase [Actinobacteria bacterium]|nr:MAG: diguanylate cyclase [Actinomycetota bacterium]